MIRRKSTCVPLAAVCFFVALGAVAAEVTPLKHAHSHNDYLHDRPLLDALDHGFNSVEADIFLVDGKLLVAHERGNAKSQRTLEALYLDPLKKRIEANGGSVFKNGPQFTLLIDLKSEAEPTYAALEKVLANYASMLTTVENGKSREGAIKIILSGDRPELDVEDKGIRYAGLDGRPADLDSSTPAHFMPMISDKWSNHFKWTGDGEMSADQKAKLTKMVDQAHATGRVLRFWATPEKESMWRELQAANVDIINTDELARLEAFLRGSKK